MFAVPDLITGTLYDQSLWLWPSLSYAGSKGPQSPVLSLSTRVDPI